MQSSDIIKTRKNNQSTLQIAANSIIENNINNRPSLINSGQGLPPRNNGGKLNDNNGQGMLNYHTDGDNYSQGLEESGQMHSGSEPQLLDINTDQYKVDMKKGNSNILVAIRCRPLSTKEKLKQSQKSVRILDQKIVILSDISAAKPEEAFRQARSKEKTYAFDYAFEEDANQQYIFDNTTKFLIEGIMQGYNASVFAYGATGAGKTYTMLGTEENPGIMMISIEELFKAIMEYSSERDYKLKVSYVEVYNENIKDLLTDKSEDYLDLREDSVKGVCVAGVTEIMTVNVDEIVKYIRQGNRMRTKERTDANEASSRSHAVLQITVEHKDKAHGVSAEINIAKFSLIDLAGSERASNTNNRGLRLVEGANINRSLLALGNCINALCDQTKSGANSKNMHIPYRDSKLTRLLKDSLGGNCRTVMITNISPAFAAYEDTLNTLKYADRAKQIKTVVKRNVLNVQFHISNYTKIITQLRDEIVSLRTQLSQGSGQPTIQQKLNQNPMMNNKQITGNLTQGQGQQNIHAQNKLKAMKIEMNLQFEKEVTIKKEIYELDMKNEDHAFKLFSKQLFLTKNKNKGPNFQVEQEITGLKQEIEGSAYQKSQLNATLEQLENNRNKMLEEYQQEMLQYEIDAIDVLYNQHLLNLKSIDIKRKENRAEFHIKQRDNYIQHLKEQLALRDKIIKEKLGISMTNFMSNNGPGNSNLVEAGHEILTMQDIDKISKELIQPSLNMTKSSSFIPHQYNNQNSVGGQSYDGIQSDSPYFGNMNSNISPNQRIVNHNAFNKGNKNRQYESNSVNQRLSVVDELQGISSSYQNKVKLIKNNVYNDSTRNQTGASQKSQSQEQSAKNNEKVSGKYKVLGEFQYQAGEPTNGNSNISFQSHRNNSNSRLIGNQKAFAQQNSGNNLQQPPGTSDGNQPKSFAGEMSKNKQKFMLMQKNIVQEPGDVFATQGRPIPKSQIHIDSKLSLLKRKKQAKDDEVTSLLSSRNQLQHQSQNTRISSSLMQNNGSQIARKNDLSSVNTSLINIIDNHQ